MKRLLLISALGLIALPAAGRERHRDRDDYRCREAIEATGEVRAWDGRAMKAAWASWQQIARGKYGLESSQPDNAQVLKVDCYDASVRASFQRQCRIVARPCKAA